MATSDKINLTSSSYNGIYTTPYITADMTNSIGSWTYTSLSRSQIEEIVQVEFKRLEKLKKARRTLKKLQKKVEKLQGVELGLENA